MVEWIINQNVTQNKNKFASFLMIIDWFCQYSNLFPQGAPRRAYLISVPKVSRIPGVPFTSMD